MSTQLRALEIVTAALELDAAAQDAYIERECNAQPELARQVRALLAVDAEADLLNTGSDNIQFNAPPPEQVGPYRIDEKIGEGGMGLVFKAHRSDGQFERTVAVKFIATALLNQDMRRRFEIERQATARLNHPNIAQLLDGGDIDGRPYFIMEYIEGEPLIYSAARSLRETVTLFIQVCDAVAHAHANLILHRDLKPGNILLTRSGTIKVLDFGVSKIISDDEQSADTRIDAIPVTRPYTSPERLVGATATVQSDVFSLGVTLYQICHGKLPYNEADQDLLQTHEKMLTNRTEINTGWPDLDLIIAQAMHGDMQRRYATVDALRSDLKRLLSGQPLAARADDWLYVGAKFVARNKAAVVAGAFAVLAMVVGLVATTTLFYRAENQAELARQERDTAEEVVGFLTNLLGETNPMESGQQEISLSQILDIAEQELEAGLLSNPNARAQVETSLSLVRDGRGEFERARELAAAAIARLEGMQASGPALANAYAHLGQALAHLDRYDEAAPALEKAMALQHPEKQTGLLINTMATLGSVYERMDRYLDAEQTYREAIRIAEQHALQEPRLLAQPTNNLGQLLHTRGDTEQAAKYYQRAADLLVDYPPERAMTLGNLAGISDLKGDYDEAWQQYAAALTLLEASLGPDHPQTLVLRTSAVNTLTRAERFVEAKAEAAIALANVATSLPEEHFITAYVYSGAAGAQCYGEFDPGGLDLARASYEIRQRLLPEGNWMIASAQSLYGHCLARAGELAAAIPQLEQAYSALHDSRGPEQQATRTALARLNSAREQLAEADTRQ